MAQRIMVVDDDVNIRSLLEYRLGKEGFSTVQAMDGLDALKKIEAQKPDLIILDPELPRMDGYQVLERLKGDPQTADIPVIVLTLRGNPARSLELGAVDFVAKPFSPRQLVVKVREILGIPRDLLSSRVSL